MKDGQLQRLDAVDSLEALYALVSNDFYVVTECSSRRDPSLTLEGTRLTLVERRTNYMNLNL